MNEKELKYDLLPDQGLVFMSNYGVKKKNGLRYPRIPTKEGRYEYSLSVFDQFVELIYTELKKKQNIAWPYPDDDRRKALVREKIIDAIGKREEKRKSIPIDYSTMAERNYSILKFRLFTLDVALSHINLEDYLQMVRKNVSQKEKSHDTQRPFPGNIIDKIPPEIRTTLARIILALTTAAASIGTYTVTDIMNTSWEEAEEKLTPEDLINLMPEQKDNVDSFFTYQLPSEDPTFKKEQEKVHGILEEQGTQALMQHYIEISNKIESGEYSYEELCDYYATSYLLPQVISQAQFCQALEEYAKEHPDDDLQHDIERITETVKQEEDATITYYELDFDDESFGYIEVLHDNDKVKVTNEDAKNLDDDLPDISESFERASSAYKSGDKKTLQKETQRTQKSVRRYLNMLTKKPVFSKKNSFKHPLEINPYRVDRNNIPENDFKAEHGE